MAVSSIISSSALTQLYYGLSADTKPAAGVQAFALFMETDTGNVFEYSGGQWTQIVTGGAARVKPVTGIPTAANNRQLLAAATTYLEATNSMTWLDSDNITEVTILVPITASLTKVLVAVNAPSAVAAANWLDQTLDSPSAEAMFEWVLPGVPSSFIFTSNILRLDFEPQGAAADIFVGAH